MTSPTPLLFDTYYHIYNRGVNRENIFIEERNYAYFLNLYEKYLTPVTDLFAYCLLKNHFHLSIRTKSEEEILETIKTLRVSPLKSIKTLKVSAPDSNQSLQDSPDSNGDGLQRKPLGFGSLGSQYYSSYGIILSEKRTSVKRSEVLEWFGNKEQYIELHQQWVTDANSKWFAEEDFD